MDCANHCPFPMLICVGEMKSSFAKMTADNNQMKNNNEGTASRSVGLVSCEAGVLFFPQSQEEALAGARFAREAKQVGAWGDRRGVRLRLEPQNMRGFPPRVQGFCCCSRTVAANFEEVESSLFGGLMLRCGRLRLRAFYTSQQRWTVKPTSLIKARRRAD